MVQVIWSNVNQAWLIMWDGSVLSVKSSIGEVYGWFIEKTLGDRKLVRVSSSRWVMEECVSPMDVSILQHNN